MQFLILWTQLLLLLASLPSLGSRRHGYYVVNPLATDTEELDHPLAKYVVSIQSNKPHRQSYYFGAHHYCVGTIISPTYVLTASHCVFDSSRKRLLSPQEMLVVAGAPNRLRPTARTLVLSVKSVRPFLWRKVSQKHDLALLRLDAMLDLNLTRTLGIAELARLPAYPQNCTVLGWGMPQKHGVFAELLTQRIFRVQSSRVCTRTFPISYKSGMICATVASESSRDVCRGDSGGPLFCGNKLAGIVSRGVRCDKKFPAIFASVFWHRYWIKSVYSGASVATDPAAVLALCILGYWLVH